MKRYKALAFDFDGTLFDTSGLNFQAYQKAYRDLGVEITEDMFNKTKGLSVYAFNTAMGVDCDVEVLRDLKKNYYQEISLTARPNSYLIEMIRTANIPVALVTTARLCNVLPLLKKYDLLDKFSVIVSQEDVENHKPSPEAYILASSKLCISPEDILAFEDSGPGYESATAAGIDCVLVSDFRSDCIKDMTGGSGSRTYLVWEEDTLFVRKESYNEKTTSRLFNQYAFLKNNDDDSFIKAKDPTFTDSFGRYDMPFILGKSLYESKDRVTLLRKCIKNLIEFSSKGGFVKNEKTDAYEECFKNYIIPGIEIYNLHCGSKEDWREFYNQDKKEMVNDFRYSLYHGDFTFENIIVDRNDNPVFIDPVPDGNIIQGLLQDFAKIGQSLYGYEAIRDGVCFDYEKEKAVLSECAQEILSKNELMSLKFHIACLYFRRLKHQIKQNEILVRPYGDIAFKLLREFMKGNYTI